MFAEGRTCAAQDLEILKGYVPGYDQILGHEFVGRVEESPSEPSLVGQRVVGEINCRCQGADSHADPIFERNHSPGRSVLGIIGRDVSDLVHAAYLALHLHSRCEKIALTRLCMASRACAHA
jgi:threonine dehydrogenase-like Zn-dependent dehydrogenase